MNSALSVLRFETADAQSAKARAAANAIADKTTTPAHAATP